jgi:Phosphotransferase enzyme family
VSALARVEPIGDSDARRRRALEVVRQRLEDASRSQFGPTAEVDLVATQHRAYSTTGRLRVRDPHGEHEVFAKTVDSALVPDANPLPQAQREHDALMLCRGLFGGLDELRVPAPLALYRDLQCVLMEAVPGRPLSAVLGDAKVWARRSHTESAVELCRLCGRWLRRLHDGTSSHASLAELEIVTSLDRELTYLDAHPVPPVTRPYVRAVRSGIRRLVERVGAEPVAVAAVHGGFAPYNVIVSPDRRAITVIDFAAFNTGPVHYDYFKFLSKLEILAFGPSFSSAMIRRFEEAFADGYGSRVEPDAPINRILRVGFLLDRMTAFAENAGSHPLHRRFLLRRLYRRHYRRVEELCGS